MTELLRLEDIHYRYGETPGLCGVSATFYAGERVAVLGNNGAGKSTLFLTCNGVLRPESGKVILKGSEISKKRDVFALRQAVGLVFQDPDSQMIAGTVEAEVSFGPMNLGLSEAAAEERVARALAQMGLTDYRRRAPHALSGGEKKRVSIADILAMEPELILFDEPTASLDPRNIALLETTLDQLNSAGIALVVATHDVDFAYRFAGRALVLNKGRVLMDAPIGEIFAANDIIKEAGLCKPLLYSAAEALQRRFQQAARLPIPKTSEEFAAFVRDLPV